MRYFHPGFLGAAFHAVTQDGEAVIKAVAWHAVKPGKINTNSNFRIHVSKKNRYSFSMQYPNL